MMQLASRFISAKFGLPNILLQSLQATGCLNGPSSLMLFVKAQKRSYSVFSCDTMRVEYIRALHGLAFSSLFLKDIPHIPVVKLS